MYAHLSPLHITLDTNIPSVFFVFFLTQNFLLKICKYHYFTLYLNILLCCLHILVYTLNIHESHSAQVGHSHRPSRYAAFYTILNAGA